MAILYRNHILLERVECNIQTLPPNFQFQVVKLSNLTFINVYCPPNIQIKKEEWNEFVKSFESPKVIVGDFNGQNPIWGSSKCNITGNSIADSLDESEIVLLNDGSPTRLITPNQNISAVDLSVVSRNIAVYFNWTVVQDCGMSDHFLIVMTYELPNPLVCHRSPLRKWLCDRANWESYENYFQIKDY